jgi:hypothetical protein
MQMLCEVIAGRTPDSQVLPSTFIARGPLATRAPATLSGPETR